MKVKLFLILLFLFVGSSVSVLAKEDAMESSPSATPTPTIINYELPYPGLLPDNPLYSLKAVRDRVIQFLISDPYKKAEFFLLSSDKRINTGNYLIIKNKDDMGVLYISKSNNYMHMAIISAKEVGERGKIVLNRVSTSIKKHEEVIKSLLGKVDKENRTKLEQELKRLKEFESLLTKKK